MKVYMIAIRFGDYILEREHGVFSSKKKLLNYCKAIGLDITDSPYCCYSIVELDLDKKEETTFSLVNKMAKEGGEENTSGAYDQCANCGYWHYTHANSTCKKFVRKEEQ